MTPEQHLDAHRAAGAPFTVPGADSFVRVEGEGPTVVCMHGVPASSYLYRKVLPELAARGCRGVAFDLPGLGFAQRPPELDYSWSGLARWTVAAIAALDLGEIHLVVHDLGGPVGLLAAETLGERVRSITVLNTIMDPASFRPPWVMRPFRVPALGEAWLAATVDPVFLALMRRQGVYDRDVGSAELLAYRRQLVMDDGGEAFLQIMRSFELTERTSERMRTTVRAIPHRQVLWGEHDPALKLRRHGLVAQEVADVPFVRALPGRHFLQEDCAPAIAEHVARLVQEAA